MQTVCDGPPTCRACLETSAQPCLVLEWMGFLRGIEHLAEREATARGQAYQRCPDERLREIAVLAATQGRHPRVAGAPDRHDQAWEAPS